MATSLYGTVKKVNSTSFVFDKVYSSRAAMEQEMASDGIYHGRYVLVSYGDKFGTNNSMANTSIEVTLPAYNSDPPVEEVTYTTNLNTSWLANYNRDLNKYQNIYDKTIWQKVFEGDNAKYIMVAQLNARAPALTINEDYYAFALENDENSNEIYYTKTNSDASVIIHDGENGEGHAAKVKAAYPIPRWHETYSNDLIYHLEMPMPLRINLAKQPEYFSEGLNASVRSEYDTLNKDASNYIRWEHILDNDATKIKSADFNFNVPAIGQIISDTYDALYGTPTTTNANEEIVPTTGQRPSSADLNAALSQTDYIGIIGILANLGLRDPNNGTYLLHSDWTATSSQFGHIENKPSKITTIAVGNDGTWTFTAVAQ